jgi:hypothetical protein
MLIVQPPHIATTEANAMVRKVSPDNDLNDFISIPKDVCQAIIIPAGMCFGKREWMLAIECRGFERC